MKYPGRIASKEELEKRKIITSWAQARRKPRDEERLKMIAVAVQIVVEKCLKNHCYKAGDQTLQQMKNGLIGPDIQRALCQCAMMRWNEKFIKKCKEISENSDKDYKINIVPKLIQTYVDDQKNIVKELPAGAEYDGENKKIKINVEKILSDTKIPSDRRTFQILKEIANEIEPDIQMTIEVSSDHKDGKLPYLD